VSAPSGSGGDCFAHVRLMAIVETAGRDIAHVLERVGWLCARATRGSVIVQLRDKDQPARTRMDVGAKLREITAEHGQLLAVNDRPDIAMLLDADAIHLGERSLTPEQVRSFGLPRSVAVSVARHDTAHVRVEGADAVVLSPIVGARKGRSPLGLTALSVASGRMGVGCRLFALGGVDAATARACLGAGASGVAVMGALWDAPPDPSLLGALGISR